MVTKPSFKIHSVFVDRRVDPRDWEALLRSPSGKLAFGDFDNDTKIDMISSYGYGGLHLNLQKPSEGRDSYVCYDGAYAIKESRNMNDVPHNAKPTTRLVITQVGDLDQDGDLDIVVADKIDEQESTWTGFKEFTIEYLFIENLTVNKIIK